MQFTTKKFDNRKRPLSHLLQILCSIYEKINNLFNYVYQHYPSDKFSSSLAIDISKTSENDLLIETFFKKCNNEQEFLQISFSSFFRTILQCRKRFSLPSTRFTQMIQSDFWGVPTTIKNFYPERQISAHFRIRLTLGFANYAKSLQHLFKIQPVASFTDENLNTGKLLQQ